MTVAQLWEYTWYLVVQVQLCQYGDYFKGLCVHLKILDLNHSLLLCDVCEKCENKLKDSLQVLALFCNFVFSFCFQCLIILVMFAGRNSAATGP